MTLGVRIHYAKYTDEDDKELTLTYEGKICPVCGTRKKYTTNRNCVKCKTKGDKSVKPKQVL